MAEKFNPAPTDKHAVDPNQAVKSDKKLYSELDKGLEDTFAASDPASSTEPAKIEMRMAEREAIGRSAYSYVRRRSKRCVHYGKAAWTEIATE
jgi:hypothetical protein